jgi:hypothetical protein
MLMILLRRYLMLGALFFWQGGFTFYGSAVVPVGQEVLGHLQQGFITRQVTNYLNLSGAVALLLLAWELWAAADPMALRRRFRWALWAGMLGALVWLHFLHGYLDSMLDPEYLDISNRKAFRSGHRLYLWVSTFQWAFALGYLLLSLRAWQAEDGSRCKAKSETGEV